MITIKLLEEMNVKEFVTVHLKCWEETYFGIFNEEVFHKRFQKKEERIHHIKQRLLEKEKYQYYCLLDNTEIVGIMIFSILDQHALLDALYLKKEYQKKGYGSKMLSILEKILKQKQIKEYSIYVFKILPSNEFFIKKGAQKQTEDWITIHNKDYEENEYIKKIGE